jgi:hypothetical protein
LPSTLQGIEASPVRQERRTRVARGMSFKSAPCRSALRRMVPGHPVAHGVSERKREGRIVRRRRYEDAAGWKERVQGHAPSAPH